MQELVSILIPCYNSKRWIAETLESALAQTWTPTEIIVVDDGSTDESIDIARSFEPRGVKVIAQQSQGACAARNRALDEAQGRFIQFLDADDLLASDKIEVQMRRLHEEPEGTVANTAWERFYEVPGDYDPLTKSYEEWRDFEDPVDWLLLAARGRAMMPLHGWLTPRSLIQEAGRWNEDLLVNQDGEYFARVLVGARKIAFCPDAKVYYRTQGRGISVKDSQAKWQSFLESLDLTYKHVAAKEDSPAVRKSLANRYKQTAFHAYPKYPEVSHIAEQQANELWDIDWRFPNKSVPVRLFVQTMGWKAARWLQAKYRKLVYRT